MIKSCHLIPELKKTDIDRFWSKVSICEEDKCWLWIGSKRRRGYGRFCLQVEKNKDKSFVATRIAYFIHYKINPVDKIVLHSCDNPECVNPNHLSLGSNLDNTNDMMNKKRGLEQFGNGSNHRQSKLTEQDVILIRNSYLKKEFSQTEIAKRYNVDSSSISNIVNRKSWTHI